jgi:hypothetical protein
VIGRRVVSKRPLAVAAMLATPLFFVSLLASSLKYEKPSVSLAVKHGKAVVVLGNPTGSNELTIWLVALVPSVIVLIVGAFAIYAPWFGVVFPATTTFLTTVLLLSQLDKWAIRHTLRYPVGVDLIPPSSPSDLLLRGEWEESAQRAAREIGYWTIGAAGLAILVTVILNVRARRAPTPPLPPPPPLATIDAPGQRGLGPSPMP